jgi:hypothetical protein
MNERCLEVTYRRGIPLAGYLHLGRSTDEAAARSERAECGLVVDLDDAGRPIGIEITAPSLVTTGAMNRVLEQFGLEPVDPADLDPLRAD